MIKTLKDLNQAGRRFWSGANAKTKDAVPPGMEKCPNCGGFGRKYGETCSVCHGKGFVPEGSDFGTDDDLYDRIKAVSEGGINAKQRELLGYARGALTSGNRVSARKYLEQALAAEDSAGYIATRVNGWNIVEGVGVNGGDWFAQKPGRSVKFNSRSDAEGFARNEDSARDFSTTPAEIETAAKKAKAAGKSKEEFVAGYSGGAAETAARVW